VPVTAAAAVTRGRAARFGARLLEWGTGHRRDLPWRRTSDPWHILVSEVMLQQTQVGRVVPYYRRFLAAYPTAPDCARARPADVVRLWSGLGYNRRALHLHGAAVAITRDHGGRVPQDDKALRRLPGVGTYTARAVRAFGHGDEVAAVDTNGARVLARAVAGAPLRLGDAMALGDRLLPAGRSWEFNQAMFDLGATVCTASRPGCGACPLRRQCRWRRARSVGGADGDGDPWRASPAARPQSAFAGSDRQGRGRLLDALRARPVRRGAVAVACGWPDDPARAACIAAALVAEGFARWSGGADPVLRLR
jgi:A/G-specific adenine glycosylase